MTTRAAVTPARVVRRLGVFLLVAFCGCMSSPKDGETFPQMGAPITFLGWAGPQQPMVFQYAVHQKTPSGYSVASWKTLATCTTSTTLYTDVEGREWGGCQIITALPTSDCTFGGTGVWRGNPADPNDGQRFARVRAFGNGFPLGIFPSTVTDDQLAASVKANGGRNTIIAYSTGTDVVVRVAAPKFGAADLTGTADATGVFVAGDRAFVSRAASTTGPELVILDISNPAAPAVLSTLNLDVTVYAVFVEGDYAYLATDDNAGELRVIDVHNPSAPVQIAIHSLVGNADALSVAAVAGMVYVGRAKRAGPEFVILEHDLVNPGTISELNAYEVDADINAIDVTRNTAYLATNHPTKKFMALDVSNPAAVTERVVPLLSGSFAARDVDYHAGRLYGVTDASAQSELFVYNAPATGSLSLLGSLQLPTNNTGVSIYGGKALISTSDPSHALTVVDVANPSALAVVGHAPASGPALGVAVRNGIAALATTADAAELQMVSTGVPLEPVISDVNGGGVTIGCLGDSNTGNWCSQIDTCFQTDTASAPTWCADPGGVWTARSTWHTMNDATGFGAIMPIWGNTCLMDGEEQIAMALCQDLPTCVPQCTPSQPICSSPCPVSDAVVIALGSVDTGNAACPGSAWPYTPGDVEVVLQTLQQLAGVAQAAGVTPFFTLVSPIAKSPLLASLRPECSAWEVTWDSKILEFNNRIRHELPRERIVDFFTSIADPDDYIQYCCDQSSPCTCPFSDPVHLDGDGQTKRARAAMAKLKD